LAGGTFFALKLTASGATTGAVAVASYPGNPASGVAGGGGATDCDGIVCPAGFTAGSGQVFGISAWNAPAMNPPAYVTLTYYNAKNCLPPANVAVLVTDPLGPTAADARLQNGVAKTGLLITPNNLPYMGGAAPILSVGVTVAAGAFQCGNNLDDDADGAINDGCSTVVVAEAVCNEAPGTCADADGQRPWDLCDDDADGGINDGCAIVGLKENVVIPDPPNYQFLACGNVDGLPVTGWTGRLTADWKLIPFSFAIDADPWNGTAPCTPVDATHSVEVGASHEVAVCTVSEPQKPAGGPDDVAAFSFNLTYDPLRNLCTAKNCLNKSPCTEDDNPDANAGATLGSGYPSFSQCANAADDDSDTIVNDGCPQLGAVEAVCDDAIDNDADTLINDGCDPKPDDDPVAELTGGLGSGWDCSGGGLIQPTCTAGTAVMACMSVAGPYTSSALSPFPLAIVKFTAILAGTDTIVTNTNVWKGVLVVEQHPPSISGIVYKEPPAPRCDLSVSKDDLPDPVAVGKDVVYTITVKNNVPAVGAPLPAANVVLVDTLPADKVYVADSATCDAQGSTCSEAGNVVTCNLGTIAVDASVVCTITATANAVGVSTNVVDVTSSTNETALVNNHDTEDTTEVAAGVLMVKEPKYDVLWLMKDVCDPDKPDAGRLAAGKGCLVINKMVYAIDDTDSPNDSGDIPEGLGAWEEQIKYDHKLLTVKAVPDNTWLESGGRHAICTMTILTENWILTGCVTKDGGVGWGSPGPQGDGLIERIYLYPKTEDLIYRQGFRPTKDNGVRTDLVDENCEVADTLGEKIPGTLPGGLTTVCSDAHITMRMLEGDVNLDCVVNCIDDQAIAFRYGTFFGLTLYDEWYDLAPECVTYPCDTNDPPDTIVDGMCEQCTTGVPDFDIDIKDLQFVFGRNYSTCDAPIPDLQGNPMLPPQDEFE